MDALYHARIHLKVRDHDRTVKHDKGWDPLGYQFGEVRDRILQKGLADFRSGYEELSADDKVLLYCFVNMRKHFFASAAVFQAFAKTTAAYFGAKHRLMIDFGCGPATACLALADEQHGRRIEYLGVDCAPAMQEAAKTLLRIATRNGILHRDSTSRFAASWDDLDPDKLVGQPGTCVLLNFSYFFASNSLKGEPLESLADFVRRLKLNPNVETLCTVYTNSTVGIAGDNYRRCMKLIGFDVDRQPPKTRNISYQNRCDDFDPKSDTFAYQVCRLKRKS
jgi:DNA replication ATP-dependent helicase Dna2